MKGKHFTIPIDIYNMELLVSVGETDEVLKKALRKAKVNDNIPSMEGANGYFCTIENKMLLRLAKFPKTPETIGTLVHEIAHVVIYVMDRTGISLSANGSEPGAYLAGYLTREIYNRV